MFRVHQVAGPLYLQSIFHRPNTSFRLTSSRKIKYEILKRRTKTADRSFAIVGPKWWNQPLNLKQWKVKFYSEKTQNTS